MSRVRSDGRAVAAILAGAALGVVGTALAVRAFDGTASEDVACVELGAPRVVHALQGKTQTIVLGPAASIPATPLCEGRHVAPSFAVIRSHGPDRVRVRVLRKDIGAGEAARARAEELRAGGEELRLRSEELRERGEELRVRGQELRVRMERLRSEANGSARGG